VSFSPNIVRNMVKLMGPGDPAIILSTYWSVAVLPSATEGYVEIVLVHNYIVNSNFLSQIMQ